jgi:hypothetical protein
MNERIEELAQGCFEYVGGTDIVEFNYKKFAELIVGECADICYNRDYAYGSAYGEQIEKQFGVQE